GEGASPLAAMGSGGGQPFMSQPMSHRGSIGASGMAPPGIPGPMGVSEQHGMSGGSGFVDPAIMNMGRINVGGSGSGPTSPVGLPPGILSPQSADSGGGGRQMQSAMLSRSANSSGRSRFLNHFSPEGVPRDGSSNAPQQQGAAGFVGARDNSTQSPAGERSEGEAETGGMVNGVPPGLPTTGLFGELLRRVKLEASAGASSSSSMPQPANNSSGSTYVSGKMMLGDIERKLDEARREARDLQAQLSTVIGQNQSAMWALANGGTSA
ncbi:hypothetical protein IWW38_002632, partial [Coemansia aciculifera]